MLRFFFGGFAVAGRGRLGPRGRHRLAAGADGRLGR